VPITTNVGYKTVLDTKISSRNKKNNTMQFPRENKKQKDKE
jgi:hypothetical protein